MTSYMLIRGRNLIDVLSNLIKFGFGSYNELMGMPMDKILAFYNWYVKDYEKEMKNKMEYDTTMAKLGCPLFRKRK